MAFWYSSLVLSFCRRKEGIAEVQDEMKTLHDVLAMRDGHVDTLTHKITAAEQEYALFVE